MSAIVLTDRIRSLRAVVFAALCVALAATAHVAMAGPGVSVPALVGAFTLVLLPTWLLAGSRRGPVLIAAWMTAAQFGLHRLFERAGSGASGATAGPDWAGLLLCNPDRAPAGLSPADLARMAGLDPDAAVVGGIPPLGGAHHAGHGTALTATAHPAAGPGAASHAVSGHGMSGHAMPGHDMAAGMSAGMLAAHLLAALACALLLWRGEAALSRLPELLGTLAAGLLPLLVLVVRPAYEPPALPRCAGRRARRPRPAPLSHVLVRRGPPTALAY
ncbi:hypothetical protein ACWEQL_06475 [Kitasatospora sp. NPDC004240]